MTGIFRTIVIGLCFVLVAAIPQFADAGFLAGFKGYSVFGTGTTPANPDSTINFAVWETESGDWTDDFPIAGGGATGAGIAAGNISEKLSGSVDKDAKFVYFYQVVNSDPLTSGEFPLDSFFVNFVGDPSGLTTGAGIIKKTVFNDGADISFANPGLGTGGGAAGDIDSPVGDGSPSSMFGMDPGFTTLLGTLNDSDEVVLFSGVGGAIEYAFKDGGFTILAGGRSPILYITSDFGPIYHPGLVNNNGAVRGDIPVPNPEPGTFLMTFGALACGLVAVMGTRRKSA